MFANKMWLGLHIVGMIRRIDLSQEIFAIDMLTALKSFIVASMFCDGYDYMEDLHVLFSCNAIV